MFLSQHDADRLMADPKVGGKVAQALGLGERADRGLLLCSQSASEDAIPGVLRRIPLRWPLRMG